MSPLFTRSVMYALVLALSFASLSIASRAHADEHTNPTYSRGEVDDEVEDLFGGLSESMALALNRVFEDYGSPNAFIKGEENSGALLFGLTYGEGELHMKSGEHEKIFWQGPSFGFDVGAENSQAFVLVYNLANINDLFQRFPGLAGKAFFIGGIGVTYLQSENTVVAVMRSGVGIRGGVNAGYLKFRREATLLPF
ncbi:MAG: EipA family protein [Hyphomicrobiales bacterium]|nr:EipA family protein [Hyphomicrobiales bacterium]MCY4049045.1 EipA family protein [Hyphomicrobiales bacterium]